MPFWRTAGRMYKEELALRGFNVAPREGNRCITKVLETLLQVYDSGILVRLGGMGPEPKTR